mmetsp:Transcript_5685/g.5859  ORF Transcript_5685/g.5859 Transcript_5685/m.5859 type:complete len:218 (-) Transcript_5685:372-1025(-)
MRGSQGSHEDFDLLFKMIIIGDSGVGKTNILSRYIKNSFSFDTRSTVGVEFGAKKVEVNGFKVKNQIWDTAGQERYRSITNTYYKGAKGALVVYDIAKRDTFDNVSKWINELRMNGEKDVVVVLVGNKCDLNEERTVSHEEGEQKARELNTAFIETSAYQAVNIDKAFTMMVEEMIKELTKLSSAEYEKETDLEGHNIVELTNKQDEYSENGKKKCC